MEWLDSFRDFALHHYTEVVYFSYGVILLGLFQNLVYFLQIPLAAIELFKMKLRQQDEHDWWLLTTDIAEPITIIIPAFNEEVTIANTVKATLATQYPAFEIIVVNDGSRDKTLDVLISDYSLSKTERFYESEMPHKRVRGIYTSSFYPNLVVIDKENGGRADALNCGINLSRNNLFCTIDADSLLDPTALLKTIQPFIEKPEEMVAAGGTIRILNGCKVEQGVVKQLQLTRKFIPLIQVAEYSRAFLMGRVAWSSLGILAIISGAFAVFKRETAINVGGFSTSTLGEDYELVMKIHHHYLKNAIPYDMRFVPEPVCWTEVPESLKVLKQQRIRWQQGGLEVFFKYREMFLNPRYGRMGTLALPLIFIFDVLGPLVEVLGYILLPLFYFTGLINIEVVLAFFCMFFMFGICISVLSLALEELSLKRFGRTRSLLRLGIVAVLENFGYRQLNNIWRITGWWRFIRGKKHWGEMQRVGISKRQESN